MGTSVIVFLGGEVGNRFMEPVRAGGHVAAPGADTSFLNWDGQWYKDVATNGYSYSAAEQSSVNYFPAYPLLGRGLAAVSGLDIDSSLLLVANLSLMGTFVGFSLYLHDRFGDAGRRLAMFILLAFGLAPPSFFFRMAYSESLFLFVTILALLGMRRNWSPVALAVLVGLATAVRPVGVALIPPLVHHAWVRYQRSPAGAARIAALLPLSLWGVAGYMAYLASRFGDPLVFVKSHESWNWHRGASFGDKVWAMATLQPIWTRFVPSSAGYWVTHDGQHNPLFSLYLADPSYFLLAVLLVAIGVRRGWLTASETLLSVGLLGIPLALKCYETDMEGFARYGAVVLPAYLVMGKLLCALPAPVATGLMSVSGAVLGLYSALFVRWYLFV